MRTSLQIHDRLARIQRDLETLRQDAGKVLEAANKRDPGAQHWVNTELLQAASVCIGEVRQQVFGL